MKIGITGAFGFIGWHVRCYLHAQNSFETVCAGRDEFNDSDKLSQFVCECDAILHLAGLNRGEEQDIASTNVALVESLVVSLEKNRVKPHVLFSSSVQIDSDNSYGDSKRKASGLLEDWADRNDATFTNLILPHVFGEGGKPFYNSAVSTFCYQLATGQKPKIVNDSELELMHAQDVAALVVRLILAPVRGDVRPVGRSIRVSILLDQLQSLSADYDSGLIPDLTDPFICRLFNTYRANLFPDYYPRSLKLHEDDRGRLFEAVKNRSEGQVFLSSTKPGVTRGNHYHFNKMERFLVVQGEAVIRVRRLFDDSVHQMDVTGVEPKIVDIPTLHAHNITNSGGEDLITLFWSNEIFDSKNPDTYIEMV